MRQWWLAAVIWLCAPLSPVHADASSWPWHYQFVAFKVAGIGQPVAGRLSFPASGEPPYPAVIIAHGSGGVDGRGPLYARRLNAAGIATLEIDMWSARGLEGGLDRPDHVRETLPDAYAARTFLAARDDIRAGGIGLMGFSWGGVMSMLAAGGAVPETTADKKPEAPFEALAALYPVCWGYNRVPGYRFERLAADSVLVIAGDQDDYDGAGDCDQLLSGLPESDRVDTELVTLGDATHAFDLRAPESRFNDPFAYRGEGGEVKIRYNPAATQQALDRVTGYFRDKLGPTASQQTSLHGKPGQSAGSLPPLPLH